MAPSALSVLLVPLQLSVCLKINSGFPAGSDSKNLFAVRETQVRSLGQEDPLEEEMASHSNILAWRVPWAEETCGLQSMGFQSD